MSPYVALLIGVVAGLRSLSAPAVVSWAAFLGWLDLRATWAAFLGHPAAAFLLGALAIAELVADQLPGTPSRKRPGPFAARLLSGGFCGAVLGSVHDVLVPSLVLGVIGAVLGTLGGYAARTRLARAEPRRDHAVAFAEDAVALLVAFLCVTAV
jgi:uncharacterized membrane protein